MKFDKIINTIKSKVMAAQIIMTAIFFVVIFVFCYTYFSESKKLIYNNYNSTVAEYAENFNKAIKRMDHNAVDLSVAGSSFASRQVSEKTMKNFFLGNLRHYQKPVGEGIWFEPYTMKPNEKFYAFNATKTTPSDIIFEDSFQEDKYNYLEKPWYKKIISQVSPDNPVVWTLSDGFNGELLITAGAGVYNNKEKLTGIVTVDWDYNSTVETLKQIKPTKNSFIVFISKNDEYIIFTTDPYMKSDEIIGKSLKELPWYNDSIKNKTSFKYHNIKYVSFVETLANGLMFIANIPENEMFGLMYIKVIILLITMILLTGYLVYVLYSTIDKDVINPINKLITIANKLASGDTSTQIRIEKPQEFALLASTYNKMTDNIKEITKKQTKMDYELSVANSIQISSLPNVFPPFPEHKEFSIYAFMRPAKEVGGDFYDFFFKDSENLMFLVADVSGKGVPAALFMMTVKTLINSLSRTISSPKELIETINKKLCADNKEGFFVTLFACIVNIYTGKMTCINCGHNPPLLKRNNGKYEYMSIEPNMVLGIFDKFEYQIYETNMHLGDSIFLYTDGITEAMNPQDEVYNEHRLEECINNIGDVPVETVIEKVRENVREYIQGQPQSDDATMLIFRYNKTLKTFKSHAQKENYNEFKNWIHSASSEWHLNDDLSNKIDMCGEEIFANICFYAYPDTVGDITVSLEKNDKELIMTFEDKGLFYNPLEKPDPDLNIPPKERQLGGLGIYMVKQMVNEMIYQRENDKNTLTLKFDL